MSNYSIVGNPHQWTLTTLTPLHIGTTENILRYEYVHDEENQRLYILDLDKLAEHPSVCPEKLAEQMRQREFDVRHFLEESEIDLEEVKLYSAHCDFTPWGQIRAFIKHLYQDCYVPGTTLKGAIRTALLWKMVQDNPDAWKFIKQYLIVAICAGPLAESLKGFKENASNPEIQLRELARLLEISEEDAEPYLAILYELAGKDLEIARAGNSNTLLDLGAIQNIAPSSENAKHAAQPIERLKELFGPEPHLDLLRTLHIADSELMDASELHVAKVDVYGNRNEFRKNITLLVETIQPRKQLNVSIKVDYFLFSERAKKKLSFADRKHYVDPYQDFFTACNEFACWLLNQEESFYKGVGFTKTADWCSKQAQKAEKLSNACLLPIGWSTGWRAKTIGRKIQMEVPSSFSWLYSLYELGGQVSSDIFPVSRRLTDVCRRPLPMGWVKLSLKEEGG